MKKRILLFGMALSLMTISCNKEEITPVTSESVTANQKMDNAMDDVLVIADDQYEDTEGTPTGKGVMDWNSSLPACADVDSEVTGNVRVTTITFGTIVTPCLFRGHYLKGQVILTHTITTTFPKTMTVTYNNFYIDGNKLEGTTTWKREMLETSGGLHPKITLTMTNMTLITASGNYVRNGHVIREMNASGFETWGTFYDDEYTTYGEFNTTHPNGDVYTAYISQTTPLLNKTSCSLLTVPAPYPVSGILELTKNEHHASIDYGDGNCDNLAMVSIDGGAAFEITLGN